jgi:hypothetical protein
MATVAILNFSDGTVTIGELPNNIKQSEDVAKWIMEELGMRINDVYFMTSDNMKLDIDTQSIKCNFDFYTF